jgi:integrase
MDTRDWARAMRNLGKVEDPAYGLRECQQEGCQELVERGRCARHGRTVVLAIVAYHNAHPDLEPETKRKRRKVLRYLEEFLSARAVRTLDQIDLDSLNAFRNTRKITPLTWAKELEILRHFFRFCLDNEWIARNWSEKVPMPKNLQPADRPPYEPNEIVRIIAACDVIGKCAYERARARAMILLLRYTALRISDVALLERSRVREGEIFVRAAKNGKAVRLPVHPDLQAALDVLPVPLGAGPDCPYFFWSGNGSKSCMSRNARRTMLAVFRASGVSNACSHRFRHTLATEVLELGGTLEEAADILGDSVRIVSKYYVKWSLGRQARISDLLARIWHTKKGRSETSENKSLGVVSRAGLEPATTALKVRCSTN